MKYMGSKNRIAKELLPIILKDRQDGQWYVEPFVGGANMIDKVDGNRIGSDGNKYVIDALRFIRDNINLIPKNKDEFSEDQYKQYKNTDSEMKGYVGFALSYGGKWFGGWRRDSLGKRDYVKEAYRNALRQNPLLQDIKLVHSSYQELQIPINSIIYCDPPYKDTTKYCSNFDHDEFWGWCRNKSKEGHKVFVSEYNAPNDFICIWSKEIVSSLTKDTGSKRNIEKLFIYNGNK